MTEPQWHPSDDGINFHTRKWVKPEDLTANGTLFGGSLLRCTRPPGRSGWGETRAPGCAQAGLAIWMRLPQVSSSVRPDDREPPVLPERHVILHDEAEFVGVEGQSLRLVVHEDTGHGDADGHGSLLRSMAQRVTISRRGPVCR